ncbi:MAG: hypothetical protein CEE38_11590 [Planctomycetes bacterium B3_Pla]|nr:MAG: hypothetical protein CEE38_11590 [Planctomycetes bacterium B3_Pla]
MRLLFEGNFWPFVFRRSPLFAAFARNEAAKRKAKAKNNSPDSREPTFNSLVAADGQSPRPRWGSSCPSW